jgi:uncharacterized membrane protein YbhN (UPF0104 family)
VPLPALEAHLLCLVLVALDVLARAVRLRSILGCLGAEVGFVRLVAITLTCDAACALTPCRAGGDAVRLASLVRAGVPWRRGLAALVGETLVTWPVILASGATLLAFAGAVWREALIASIRRVAAGLWPPPAAAVVPPLIAAPIGVVVLIRLRRWLPSPARRPGGARPRPSTRLLVSTVPLTLVAVVSRVSILAALMARGPEAAPLSVTLAGSFFLLYSQFVLPMPAGAGAVDMGLLAAVDSGALPLLVVWRFYTSGIGLILGLAMLPSALGLWRRRAASSMAEGSDLVAGERSSGSGACPGPAL